MKVLIVFYRFVNTIQSPNFFHQLEGCWRVILNNFTKLAHQINKKIILIKVLRNKNALIGLCRSITKSGNP